MKTYSIYIWILLIIIFMMAILLRSYLLIKYKWVGKDTFYNLIVAKIIRTKNTIPKSIDCFIMPETYSYPPLLHILLSKFDSKMHNNLQYIGVFFDILTGLLIFSFCFFVFDLNVAVIACTLYLFTPMTIDSSFSLGPRSPSNFFMVASLMSLVTYYLTEFTIAIYISTVFASFVLLTHRLATQSLIFSMVAISIWYHSIIPISIIIMSLVLSIIVTKGYYIRVLIGHIDFIKVFSSKIIKKQTRKEMNGIFPKPINFIYNLPIFILFVMSWPVLKDDSAITFFYIVGISLTILSLIWIFGEGVRHMSNAIFSFAIIGAYLFKFNIIYPIIAIIFISLLFSIHKILRMEKMLDIGNITTNNMLKGFEYIKSHHKSNDILLCLPLDITYNAAYFTDCIMLQSSGGFAQGLDFNQGLKKQLKSEKLTDLVKKYNVQWIFTMSYDEMLPGEIVFQDENVVVCRITN